MLDIFYVKQEFVSIQYLTDSSKYAFKDVFGPLVTPDSLFFHLVNGRPAAHSLSFPFQRSSCSHIAIWPVSLGQHIPPDIMTLIRGTPLALIAAKLPEAAVQHISSSSRPIIDLTAHEGPGNAIAPLLKHSASSGSDTTDWLQDDIIHIPDDSPTPSPSQASSRSRATQPSLVPLLTGTFKQQDASTLTPQAGSSQAPLDAQSNSNKVC
jgi:hypothetical protein